MNILLIGCGRTGRAIAESLLELSYTTKVYLYSRTSKSSKALACDLDSNKVEVVEHISLIKNLDYAIITLSGMSDSARAESMNKRHTTYEVRQDELKFNIGAIGYLLKDLNNLDKKTKIIIVTNPVDEITNYIQSMLPDRTILGFGLELDAKRYEKLLGKKILCIGSHGKAIPIINAKSEKEYNTLLNKTDSELLTNIRKHGIPHKIAGAVFKNFFDRLNSTKEEIVHVSSYLTKPFCGVKDISISLPFKVKKGNIIGISNIQINDIEKKIFLASITELQESIKHIIDTHKKLVEYK